jgi:hypothetical protein
MNVSAHHPDSTRDALAERHSRDDVLTYTIEVVRSREGGLLLALAACVLLVAAVRPAGAQNDPNGGGDAAPAVETSSPVVVFTITDSSGRTIIGADVLVRPDGSEPRRRETGGAGVARFDELPSGCATVTVLADRMRTFGDRFAIAPDVDFQSILIELTPRAGNLLEVASPVAPSGDASSGVASSIPSSVDGSPADGSPLDGGIGTEVDAGVDETAGECSPDGGLAAAAVGEPPAP